MSKNKFSAPYSSREIYFDGKPFITIHRDNNEAAYLTDDLSKLILKLLKKSRVAKKIVDGTWTTKNEV
jgi:hypothetical protein